MRWPLDKNTITQGWGARPEFYKNYGQLGHNGVDLAANVGDPVFAVEDGTVLFEGWAGGHSWVLQGSGIHVLIKHASIVSNYAHLNSTVVNTGQFVKKGQLIGYVGLTGIVQGSHLHFEVFPHVPNFKNGFAGRIDPMPHLNAVKTATDAEIRQAFRDILERDADPNGLAHYRKYTNAFVRDDLAKSQEKRDLDARKAQAAKAAAEKAQAEAAQRAAEAKMAAEAKAAHEAAVKAEAERVAAEAELARIAEEERIAREEAEAKAQEHNQIEETAKPEDIDMATSAQDKVNPIEVLEPTTPTEASKSAGLFVARVASQVTAAAVIAQGFAAILEQQVSIVLAQNVIGWITLGIAAVVIFWAQFGYRLAESKGWKWAANLKWPF